MFANRSGKMGYHFVGNKIVITCDGKVVHETSHPGFVKSSSLCGTMWSFEEKQTNHDFGANPFMVSTKGKCTAVGPLEFKRKYGLSPKTAGLVTNGMIYSAMVEPYEKFKWFFRTGVKGRIDVTMWRQVVKNFDLMEEVEADGLHHLIPIVAASGKNPQELRKMLGKGMWKKIAANSRTRNKKIASHIIHTNMGYGVSCEDIFKDKIADMVNCRSGAFVNDHTNPNVVEWLVEKMGTKYIRVRDALHNTDKRGDYEHAVQIRRNMHMYIDTKLMAVQTNSVFNPDWSVTKMREKHDEYTLLERENARQRRMDRDSAYRIRYEGLAKIDLGKFYPETEWEFGSAKARILTRYDQIEAEGVKMHHCVGGYAERAVMGEYVVVHIDGNEPSTLGLNAFWDHNGVMTVSFNQHYGNCNKTVTCEDSVALAKTVLQSLNSMKLTKEDYDQARKD